VVQLVLTLWDVFQTLREQLSQIFEVVKTVVDALDKIVKGTLEPAQKKVEEVLAGVLPVAIGLLARLVGLGGLGKKVEEFIESVQERVDKAITKLLKKIKSKIKKLFGKGEKGKQDGDEEGAEGVPAALSQKRAFQAGGETHHLWIERRRGKLVPMVASEHQPVEEAVDSAPDEQKNDAAEADSVLSRLERELTAFEDDESRGDLDEVDSLEAKLTEELAPLVAGMGASDFTPEERVVLFATGSRYTPQKFDEEEIFKPDDNEAADAYEVSSPEPFKKSDYLTYHVETRDGGDAAGYEQAWKSDDRTYMLESTYAGGIWAAGVKQKSGPRYAFFEKGTRADVVFFVGEKAAAPELVEALDAAKDIKIFLLKMVEGSAEGLSIDKYVGFLSDDAPRRGKNRELVGGLIRGMDSGNHEWIPVSIAGEVAAYAWKLNEERGQKQAALEWVRAQLCLRTPTDLLLVRRFDFEVVEVEGEERGSASPATEEVRLEGSGENMQVAGAGGHPGSVLTKLAHVTSMVEPFHEFLRQTFRDMDAEKNHGPKDFLKEVQKQLSVLLWDGSDISASADLETPVGNLSSEDVSALEEAASKAGVSLTVEEGELTLQELNDLAKQLKRAVEKDLVQMAAAKCWKA
jgi:hypothetical protein